MIRFKVIKTEKQLALCEKLATEIWTEHYTPIIGAAQVTYMLDKFQSVATMQKQIADGVSYYLVQHKENAIGYFSFYPKDQGLFLSKIYLLAATRGQGFGKECLDFIAQQATNQGLSRIALTVNKYNSKSIAAYKKMGFETMRELVMDIGAGFVMDDYWMEKILADC